MPVTGEVETFFRKFELDHSFPTKQTTDDIYDLMDHQRVSQLYLWSLPIVGTSRCLIDNRNDKGKGKATVGSRTEGLRTNPDGSFYMLLGPGDPPKGWEANYVKTQPGRGWFPYMRAYGAGREFFDDTYKLPTVNEVKDFSEDLR